MSICCYSLAGTAACRNCRNNNNAGTDYHVSFSDEAITNADRIREMSDEELANFLWERHFDGSMFPMDFTEELNTIPAWFKWLKQEVNE